MTYSICLLTSNSIEQRSKNEKRSVGLTLVTTTSTVPLLRELDFDRLRSRTSLIVPDVLAVRWGEEWKQ